MSDHGFAGKAGYFDRHYGEVRGRVRLQLVLERLLERLPPAPARILDAGGGTGAFAIPLAAMGHEVTILDPLEEWIGVARQRATEASVNVRLVQGTAEEAPELLEGGFDAVLCHVVLAYSQDAAATMSALRSVARPGAILSSLEKNRDGLAMRPGIRGNYAEARRVLDDPFAAGGLGIVNRAFGSGELRSLLLRTGWRPNDWAGVRVFSDTAPEPPDEDGDRALLELDREAGSREPYRRVARFIHVLADASPAVPPSFAQVQASSLAGAARPTVAALPKERALSPGRLSDFLDRQRYATLSTTRRDGRPHATMVAYLAREGRIWLPSVPAAIRLENLAHEPTATLVVSHGEGDDHTMVVVEGDAIVHEDVEALLSGFLAEAWERRFGTELNWAGAVIELMPVKILSFGPVRVD